MNTKEILQALLDGKQLQFKSKLESSEFYADITDTECFRLLGSSDVFHNCFDLRIKPEEEIKLEDLPKPMTTYPYNNMVFYTPSLVNYGLVVRLTWDDSEGRKFLFENGLVFATRESAKKVAEYLIQILIKNKLTLKE